MEMIRAGEVVVVTNSGTTLRKFISPENSRSKRVTITRVSVAPGVKSAPHRHASEQVWVALRGSGQLLLDNGRTMPFAEGDAVRFEDNDLHGFENTGGSEFEYLSVVSPAASSMAP